MAKAKSISAASLTKLTQAAVKAATADIPGKFTGKGPTMGYILQKDLGPAQQLALATRIAEGIASNAKNAGIVGLKPAPVVVLRPGKIIAGFLSPELLITIK